MQEAGYDVISIGKINDIFCGEGITESLKSKSSVHGMEQTIETAGKILPDCALSTSSISMHSGATEETRKATEKRLKNSM